MKLDVRAFFDPATWTLTYVVKDPNSASCAIIDSVLDYDAASGRTKTDSADQVIHMVKSEGLSVEWIVETHVHADHISAAPYFTQSTRRTNRHRDAHHRCADHFWQPF